MTMNRSEPGIPAQAEAKNILNGKLFLNEKTISERWEVFFSEILDLNEKTSERKTSLNEKKLFLNGKEFFPQPGRPI